MLHLPSASSFKCGFALDEGITEKEESTSHGMTSQVVEVNKVSHESQ